MFIPGETITHEFIIPFKQEDISKVIITYKQNDRIVLTRPVYSFESISDNEVKVVFVFSQSESLLFDNDCIYTIQLNVYNKYGARSACEEIKQYTGTQHYEKVINDV